MGFYGVELGAIRDEIHLPSAEDLQSDKDIDAVRKLYEDKGVEIAAIASIYSFHAREKNVRMRSVARTIENIELASKLGCPMVRVPLGAPVGREPVEHCLARQVPHLSELARIAAKNNVTLLMCNTPGLPSSRAVWFVVDGVSHPGVRAAWNPVYGRSCGEASTVAVPRLGARIKAIQAGDARFDDDGRFQGFCPIGEGVIDYVRTTDLLKGVLFDGYLLLDWPADRVEGFPAPEEALSNALGHLIERIKYVEPELTAYKKDKNAANWSAATAAFVERKVVGGNGEATADDAGASEGEAQQADDGAPRVPKGEIRGSPRWWPKRSKKFALLEQPAKASRVFGPACLLKFLKPSRRVESGSIAPTLHGIFP